MTQMAPDRAGRVGPIHQDRRGTGPRPSAAGVQQPDTCHHHVEGGSITGLAHGDGQDQGQGQGQGQRPHMTVCGRTTLVVFSHLPPTST
ncbi:hypothetical protein ACFU5B_13875 [Streptomyces murinus]|uniref:hypothetical protein n=1 Tax=Streptomyces murinus TaxID=33900 RepID=UPI00362BE129